MGIALVLTMAVATTSFGVSPAAAATYPITWTPINVPPPPDAYLGEGGIGASSCPVVGWCVAIGSYVATTPDPNVATDQGSITLLSGNDVTGIKAPLPPDASAEPGVSLNDVSCSQPGTCVIVGSYLDGNGQEQGLIETLLQGTWSSQQAPRPPDTSDLADFDFFSLSRVRCDLSGDCVAIGTYAHAVPVTRGVIESEIGGIWTETAPPLPPDAYSGDNPNYLENELMDLSCPTVSSCVAVGAYALTQAPSYGQLGPQYGMFVDALTGGAWVASEVPLPPDAAVGIGLDITYGEWVSCAAPGQCGVTGGYFTNAAQTNERGIVSTLDGGTWASLAAPVPGNATLSTPVRSAMRSISCAAPGACVAVGFYQTNQLDSSGATIDQSVIDTLSGGVWAPSEAPPPTPDTPDVGLAHVSCPALGQCVASGNYPSGAVFENQDGDTWVPTVAPLPQLDSTKGSVDVSPLTCPAVGACNDAITYFSGDRQQLAVIDEDPSLPPTVTAARAVSGAVGGVAYQAAVAANGSVPTGSVSFFTGSLLICVATLSDGIGTCSSSVPTGPTVAINASYSGNFTLAPSTSPVSSFVQPTPPPITPPPSSHGYWLVGSDGGIFSFGSAQFHGSTGSLTLQRPVVGITPTIDRGGYWLVGSDGGIFSFGDSRFYGSIPGLGYAPAGTTGSNHLNAPIVGMVPSSDGGGYFMVASDGGVFAFGDAKFEGSCPGIGGCSGAAVAVMPDASGNGYWMVTATGHVYAFGDAVYYGAPGSQSSLVTSAHRTTDGKGYWILFSNGGVASYGDAGSFGSPAGGLGGSNPATAILPTADGGGYWVTSALGKIFNYGDAPNQGDMSGKPLNGSIIAAAGW